MSIKSIDKPKPPYECIEHAVDPKLYWKLHQELDEKTRREVYGDERYKDLSDKREKELRKKMKSTLEFNKKNMEFPKIDKNSKFRCLNWDCGNGASFGKTGSDVWDHYPGQIPGQVCIGRGEYCPKHADHVPLFGDCPMCEGKGQLTWKRFELEYDKIMEEHNKEFHEYEKSLNNALQAKKKLSKAEFDSIVAYLA